MEIFDYSLIKQGGLIMWPLLALSLLAFILFIERTLYLHRGQIRSNEFIEGIKNLLRKRRLLEALTVCEETPGPLPIMMKAALLNYNQGEPRMRNSIQAAALVQIPLLERRIGTISAIARIAPLLGLLGTVIGMIKAFFNLQAAGAYAHQGILASGLGEALITTATGLCIAILAYLAYHFLHGRLRALVHDMEYVGNEIMQFLLYDLPEEEIEPVPVSDTIETNTSHDN